MARLEFHFDFGSPNAYLAHCAIPQIEQRTGATFDYMPVLIGGVFKATNNVSPVVSLQGIRNKPEYMQIETQRWLKRYGIDMYVMNPHFPVNTVQIMRGAVFSLDKEYFAKYVDEVFRYLWREGRNMNDAQVIAQSLAESGLPADDIMAGMQSPEVKQKLKDLTAASVERGSFGSPMFYLDDEVFFGKDTLRDIEEMLLA